MNSGTHFAELVSAAPNDTAALKDLMQLSFGTDFIARLARKELHKIGIQVDTNDSQAQAANVR